MAHAEARELSTELGIKSPAAKFYNLLTTQLHEVQNLTGSVHETKLHEGERDWHAVGSLKHWTYVIDGKVQTCEERIEAIDEQNKTIKSNISGGDINQHYKTFKLIVQVIDNNNDGGAAVKCIVEYVKIHDHEDIEPPHGYIDYFNNCIRDIDANLLKV